MPTMYGGGETGADNGAVSVSLSDIATKSQVNNTIPVDVTATYSSPVSPPPYMVGMVERELDKETGAVKILDYQAVVDCGIPVNPNLARVQTAVSYTHLDVYKRQAHRYFPTSYYNICSQNKNGTCIC